MSVPFLKYLLRPRVLARGVVSRMARFLPDELYLSMMYYLTLGRRLDLKNPRTYTEKLQWLKLYYHRPECTTMVDKERAKRWVADRIGEEYVIPTLGAWDRAEDIDFDALPDRFVLKCNHDNNSVVICKDKTSFDMQSAKTKLARCLRRDFYVVTREWPYKDVPHRIIAEEYLDDGTDDLKDYKFFCFDGVPKAMYVIGGHSTHKKTFDYYDMDFRPLPIVSRVGAPSGVVMEEPERFAEMKRLAATLSAGFPHVRVDFYQVRGCVYWGEMTFFPTSGYNDMCSLEWDRKWGEWLTLPSKWVEK